MKGVLRMLEGGDRRSIGRVDEVVAAVRKDQRLIAELPGWTTRATLSRHSACRRSRISQPTTRSSEPVW